MSKDFVAHASVVIDAPTASAWEALVKPEAVKQYMFGTDVVSDWKVGSSIVWRGEWHGSSFEDKGVILQSDAGHILQYSHFSALTGLPDEPDTWQRHHNAVRKAKNPVESGSEGAPRPRSTAGQHVPPRARPS